MLLLIFQRQIMRAVVTTGLTARETRRKLILAQFRFCFLVLENEVQRSFFLVLGSILFVGTGAMRAMYGFFWRPGEAYVLKQQAAFQLRAACDRGRDSSRSVIIFDEERPSDSPFVERVWQSHSEGADPFVSIAESRWEMVVMRLHGKLTMIVRGPETKATLLGDCPAEGEWLGIRFKLGTVMPHLPASKLLDGTLTLPEATSTSFWLHGSAWQFPTYDNADTFVERLVRDNLLVCEPAVGAALQGQLPDLSLRSVQRHFLQTAGITHSAARQIERARYATLLLQQGKSIIDTMYEAGYFDQPHLTRSLKYYIGQTPAQIMDKSRPEQLSFLYKTMPFS